MFCGNCGTQNPDNAAFCKQCGTQLRKPVRTPAPAPGSRAPVERRTPARRPASGRGQLDSSKLVVIGAIALAAIILLGAIFWMFGGRSYKATVKQFVSATFDGNASKIMKLIPDKLIEEAMKEGGYRNRSEMAKELDNALNSQLSSVKLLMGDKWSYSYKITAAEKVSESQLEKLKNNYGQFNVKISDAMTVKVELTIKAMGLENSDSMDIGLVKSGSSWYIDIESVANLF